MFLFISGDVQRCTYENEYGCDEHVAVPGTFRILGTTDRTLGTAEKAGIIVGAFVLIIIIVIIIIVCCYRKQRGIPRKWKEETLGSVNTDASIHSLHGRVNKESYSTRPWTSESSKAEFASIRLSPELPRVNVSPHAHSVDRD